MKLIAKIEAHLIQQSTLRISVVALILCIAISWLDYRFGSDLSLALFYLIPIAMLAWTSATAVPGVLLAVACALLWYIANILESDLHEHPLLSTGNLGSRLGFFIIFALLVAHQRKLLDRERIASRTDFLTGALNRRAFRDTAEQELKRASRHERPLTIAYLDLDDFKAVNDQYGHAMGDAVLQRVVATARAHLRSSDSIARLGGDEFAILLPETDHNAAKSVVDKIAALTQRDLREHALPISLSIGVLSCESTPESIDAVLRKADQLMYQIKAEGKNDIRYATFNGAVQAHSHAGNDTQAHNHRPD